MHACPEGAVIRSTVDPTRLAVRCREGGWRVIDGRPRTASEVYGLIVFSADVLYNPEPEAWDERLSAALTSRDALQVEVERQWHDSVCACLEYSPERKEADRGCVNGYTPPSTWPIGDIVSAARTLTERQES